MFCRNCGLQIDATDKFCKECGAMVDKTVQPSNQTVPPPSEAPVEFTRAVFCMECGQRISVGAEYCLNCGRKAGAGTENTSASRGKKKRGKRTAGILLVVLQLVSLLGAAFGGSLGKVLQIRGTADFFRLFGYFLCGIIGIILLINDKKQNG